MVRIVRKIRRGVRRDWLQPGWDGNSGESSGWIRLSKGPFYFFYFFFESWNVSRRLTLRSLPFIRSQAGEKSRKRAIIDAWQGYLVIFERVRPLQVRQQQQSTGWGSPLVPKQLYNKVVTNKCCWSNLLPRRFTFKWSDPSWKLFRVPQNRWFSLIFNGKLFLKNHLLLFNNGPNKNDMSALAPPTPATVHV